MPVAHLDSVPPDSDLRIDLPDPPEEPALLRIAVSLRGAKPPVWRRIQLRGDLTLLEVDDVVQQAMGWLGGHLHRFYPGTDERGAYFLTEFDLDEGEEGTPEGGVRLDQLLRSPGDRIRYDYDFGDGWVHLLTLEEVSALQAGPPRCLGGARACPPEDVGGVQVHNELAAWFAAGQPVDDVPDPFEDVAQLWRWLPPGYDPAAFDAEEVSRVLARDTVAAAARSRLPAELSGILDGLDALGRYVVDEALADLPAQEPTEAQVSAGVRHWRVLLEAIGDGVRLTGAGYLPPRVVAQVFEGLGLEEVWIGRGNREDLTPPVAHLRRQAQRLGLVRKAKGALTPTAAARRVVAEDQQLWAFVRSRLPLGKAAEAEAGWFALLLVAAGRSGEELREGVAGLLTSRGWRTRGGDRLARGDAWHQCRATVGVLAGPRGLDRHGEVPPVVRALAADLLRDPT